MRFTFGDMTKEVNVFNLGKQPRDVEDQTFEVNRIENLTSVHNEIESSSWNLNTSTLIRLSILL